MTKRIALLLAVVVYAASLTGCSCCRRMRDTLCRGAFCGSRAPVLGTVQAPAPQAIVAAPQVVTPQVMTPQFVQPQIIRPQVIQPQMQVAAPQCVPCQPVCPCPCPCPTVVCDPCSPCCDDCSTCSGGASYSGYSGDCECNAPFGINVGPGEYLGEVQSGSSGWESSPTPADSGQDPGPGT